MSWEVWTMKSRMSFFDPTLLKKNISRFAPAWAILLAMMLLTYPVLLMRRVSWYRADDFLLDAEISGPFFSIFAAILFAGLLFKYLHRANAAYMMHAFPMSRTCLFVTNAVSGLLFYLVPMLVTVLAMQGVLVVREASQRCTALLWAMAGKWLLEYLFFYGLAVFCCFLSGNTIITVLSYFALNFIVMLIPMLVEVLAGWYFYGLDWEIPEWLVRLSPIIGMVYDGSEGPLWLLVLYAILGLGLGTVGWVLYRNRHIERAGDAMVFRWAEILFRLLFTFCGGLYLGMFFASFRNSFGNGHAAFLPYAIVGIFLCWFGATMMLQRTVKVFRQKKVWLGFAVFCGVVALFVGCLKYDVLGWQRRVPETAEIASVEIWTQDYEGPFRSDRITLTDPEQINVIRSIHSDELTWREQRTGSWNIFDGIYYDLHIVYHLQNGTTIRRAYNISSREQEKLAAIYADGTVAAAWYEANLPRDIALGTLYGQNPASVDSEGWWDENGNWVDSSTRYCHDGKALRDALLADAAAGRLPVRSGSYYYYNDGVYAMELTLTTAEKKNVSLMIPSTATETLALFSS